MKKKIALAAILAATITLTGCELPFEIKMKGNESETSSNSTSSAKKDENSKPDSSKPSSGNASYEPLTMNVGEIVTSGDVQYFECSAKYGNACEVIYRYIFTNGKFDSALLKVKPVEVKDLRSILDKMEDEGADSYKASDFTEVIDGWTLTQQAFEFEPSYQNMSIESLYALMQLSMLMGNDSNPESSVNSAPVISTPESVNSTPSTASNSASKPNYDEINFEPVVQTVGSILEQAGKKYFETRTRYGNACQVVYKYIFENNLFSDCECRVEPLALTEIDQIVEDNWYRVGEIGAYEVSDFKKVGDVWVLTKEGWDSDAKQFYNGADINTLHSMLKMMEGVS